MLLHLTDHSSEPLHSQITRQVRAKILAGELVEGDSLPSIRSMASVNEVSVITVKRAYADMETEGLIEAIRRRGFTVMALSAKRRNRIALSRFREKLIPVVTAGLDDGLDIDQIRKCIEDMIRHKEAG